MWNGINGLWDLILCTIQSFLFLKFAVILISQEKEEDGK